MSILTDSVNCQAFVYNKNILDKLIAICDPIFSINISTFAYFRFFDSRQYLYLCNNLKWTEYRLLYIRDNNSFLGKEISHAKKDGFYYYLWPTVPNDKLLKALYKHNIWNGLSIFRRLGDSVEVWAFATSKNNDFMHNFYMHNIDLLKNFTLTFNQEASNFIDPSDAKLVTYKNITKGSSIDFSDPYNIKEINKFILSTNIKKYPIITQKGEIFLSPRENQCLNHLSFGKSMKEIGKELNISHRSVELYIKNARSKIGSKNKYDTIAIFKKSCKEWF